MNERYKQLSRDRKKERERMFRERVNVLNFLTNKKTEHGG